MAKPVSAWQRLKASLESGRSSAKADPEREIRLAAAVLMVEMARADNEHSAVERETLVRLLTQRFSLTVEEAQALSASAEQSADRSISLYEYLNTLNSNLERTQKKAVLKMLWQIAYADQKLDPYEEQLLRQITDLLHLDHDDFIRVKLEVLGQS